MSEVLNLLYFLAPLIIASMVPLSIVAIGALFSERSGVINIALEGIMIMGGFVGILTVRELESTNLPLQMIALIGLVVGAFVGLVFSITHAYASIHMKSNQIISATALNMFAPAMAIFVARTLNPDSSRRIVLSNSYLIRRVPILSDIPFIGDVFFTGAYLSTFLGVLLFIVAILVLYKTRLGLRLRSCGENPQAADSLGVNIYLIRYIGVLISGAMAGMGGVIFVLSFGTRFSATVIGFGFLSLAVLIFGQWRPGKIVFAALFFATMRVIGDTYSGLPILSDWRFIPPQVYKMLPFVATIIVLSIASKSSRAPRAAGEPYDAGKR